MTGFELAALGFFLMLGAIFLRMPIAIAMAVTGFWVVGSSGEIRRLSCHK